MATRVSSSGAGSSWLRCFVLRPWALQAQGENAAETEVYTWTVLEKRLQSTRTWPYNTEMLRTFVLTVLTPIAVGMA